MNLKALGIKISELRKAMGLSQLEVAAKTSVARGSLQQLESGDGNPTVSTLTALGDFLKFDPFAILAKPIPPPEISEIKKMLEQRLPPAANPDLQKIWASWLKFF